MNRGLTGHFEKIAVDPTGSANAFCPAALPPQPPLLLSAEVRAAVDQALISLGRLDSVSSLLPDPHLFIYMYVRKEAVLSSQIEGTASSLSDLLRSEVTDVPYPLREDILEVSNYVAALEHGIKRIRGGFPLSNRLLREIHTILMRKGRGAGKRPGEFRKTQNWIGGSSPAAASFIPPPPHHVENLMGDLEKFLHQQSQPMSTLLKAALAHVQFETIHPFLDGNGRTGRLLITLLLCSENVLQAPLLYLSLYFKKHREEYFRHLEVVRKEGDWESWIHFFSQAIHETAEEAVKTARNLTDLFEKDRDKINALGRVVGSALRIHHALQKMPVCTINELVKKTKISSPTVGKIVEQLMQIGLVNETTGRQRDRIFTYKKYLQILNEGTEVLPKK